MLERIKPYLRFFVSKVFLINLILAIAVAMGIVFGTISYLKSYTHLGEKIAVPNLIGVHIDDLNQMQRDDLVYIVNDSVFSDVHPKGTVIRQDPDPHEEGKESYVKSGRKIYLTVVSMREQMVEMPNLIDNSKKLAVSKLEIIGLKYTITTQPYLSCENCVIKQLYKGKEIEAGTRVPKGSTIQIVVGEGKGGGVPFQLDDYTGLTISQVNQRLGSVFVVVNPSFEGCANAADSAEARVYMQVPKPGELPEGLMKQGATLTVFLKKGFEPNANED
jgi:eukaryotic-like serine/threonine-protein kinase